MSGAARTWAAWMPVGGPTVDARVPPSEASAALEATRPRHLAWDGTLHPGPAARAIVAPPGAELVAGAWVGDASPHARVVSVSFETRDVFLSTDRHCLPAYRRKAVADTYTFLVEVGPAGWEIRAEKVDRRRVPTAVVMDALRRIDGSEVFRQGVARFGDQPWATRLAERPTPRPVGIIDRLRGRAPPEPPPPPERQVKYVLERWLPPGTWRFGDVFFDPRELADTTVTSEHPLLAWTVELWEMPGPRYVHWHFHGLLIRLLDCPAEDRILVAQHFRV